MIDVTRTMDEIFYVAAWERGAGGDALPTWGDRAVAGLFDESAPTVARQDIAGVPGAFQITGLLSDAEADRFVTVAGELGFHLDAPVSLPHDVRHNTNVNWIVSEGVDGELWRRMAPHVSEHPNNQGARGLNARFRFYRYGEGDYFRAHTDGAWPGSRIVNDRLQVDAYPGLMSQYTCLIFLTGNYDGGATQFIVSASRPGQPAHRGDEALVIDVATPKGAALCFPHGQHPLHCVHGGAPVGAGVKVIIRTDVLFGPDAGPDVTAST